MTTKRSGRGEERIRPKVASALRHLRRRELVGFTRSPSAEQVLAGYRRGRVPWPRQSLPVIPWFAPNPRAVVYPEHAHVGKNVRRLARRADWTTTVDAAFEAVVDGCAARSTTWINADMREIYVQLHGRGAAYSLEVWDEAGDLIGGLYGVQTGGVFGVDSQFHFVDHASKVGFGELARRLRGTDGAVIDCQFPAPHLTSLGADALPAKEFSALLRRVRDQPVALDTAREPISRLVEG